MKKLLQISLGIVTTVGGFLEVLTGRPIRRFLKSRDLYSVYEVPWQRMDLSDQKHPRLRIAKRDLRHAT